MVGAEGPVLDVEGSPPLVMTSQPSCVQPWAAELSALSCLDCLLLLADEAGAAWPGPEGGVVGGEMVLLLAAHKTMFLEGPPHDLAWGLQTVLGYKELSGEPSAACLQIPAGGRTASACWHQGCRA